MLTEGINVAEHLSLVRRAAGAMKARLPGNVEFDDLFQAGALGLMEALRRFRDTGQAKFETFAIHRVHGAMIDELRATDWAPRSLRRRQRAIGAAVPLLAHRLGRMPSDTEVSDHLGVPLETYRADQLAIKSTQLVEMDDGDADPAEEAQAQDVSASQEHDPAHHLYQHQLHEMVLRAFRELEEREQFVIDGYYARDLTLKKIGAELGVTESRVCQILRVALGKLRDRVDPR